MPAPDSTPRRPVAAVRRRRRTLGVLAATQVLGGIGVAAGIAVGALYVRAASGSDALAGLAQPAAVLGSALFAVPIAAIATRHGRGTSLAAAYLTGAAGSIMAAAGAARGSWPLLLSGLLLFGGASAALLAARFAAIDTASPRSRARDLSLVLWVTTIGSVAGPNLAAPGEAAATGVGLPAPVGPFLLAAAAFALAGAGAYVGLRSAGSGTAAADDARRRPGGRGGRARAWREIRGSGDALTALTGMVTSHAVMFGVMSMTPVHMGSHGSALGAIGFVMSAHIAGMYALSPLVGALADRAGRIPVLALAAVLLATSAVVVAGASGDQVARLLVGLVLLGVGWSCGLIAGSALLTDSVADDVRPMAQGLGDLAMNVCGAAGGVAAGLVVAVGGYATLGSVAAGATAPLLAVVVVRATRSARSRTVSRR